MCGIAGFFGHLQGWDPARLTRMRDTLAHRGPDGSGLQYFGENGRPLPNSATAFGGFAHRRLSIIDLSEAGSQPMSNEDGSVWITYNGEFYNFADYRKELETKGHIFRSRCDTEMILHLYEEYGIRETLNRMNGMFAFGLWDANAQKLILARDRFGKKPLYYLQVGEALFFASEMKALYSTGCVDPTNLDEQALIEALRYGTTFGERTVLSQIRAVPAGCYAEWQRGMIRILPYYSHPFERIEPVSKPVQAMADELEELLADAVRIRFVADVPVGIFLSGGVDSSLVVALTAKRLRREVETYTISFREREYDESDYARAIAQALKVPAKVLPSEIGDEVLAEKIAKHIDQPLADASLIPTYLVAQAAREAGAKVVLTGDGGDEVFGGYETYRTALKIWGSRAERRRIRHRRTWSESLWEKRTALRGPAKGYLALQQQFAIRHLRKALRHYQRLAPVIRRAETERLTHLFALPHRHVFDRWQYSDMKTMMVDDILRKVDLMSMANGLECRCPFLDYRVVEFAARLSLDDKVDHAGRAKAILKRVLSRYVPVALIDRPKMGFCMPWAERCTDAYIDQLIARWKRTEIPHLRKDAAEWLFREQGQGALFRKWNAFVHLVFFENIYSRCRS